MRQNFHFVFSYSGQDTEGHEMRREFNFSDTTLKKALESFFIGMDCKDYESKAWTLLGTRINGVDANKYIREMGEDMRKTDPKARPLRIPTPEQAKEFSKKNVRETHIPRITTAILDAMKKGRNSLFINKFANAEEWEETLDVLVEDFDYSGWTMSCVKATEDGGTQMHPIKLNGYKITWKEKR